MQERTGVVTFKGRGMTLLGPEFSVGDTAPAFALLGTDLAPVTSESFAGKVLLIVSVPSLDTAVCNVEARRFNAEAEKLGEGDAVLVVSMDLPFAQKRWAEEAGADTIITASDHRDASFGLAFGLLVKELRLLARAVYVLDRAGKATYCEIVREMTDEPDYGAAIAATMAARG
jgi:thiol peroxidase